MCVCVFRTAKSMSVLRELVQYAMSLVEEEEQEGEEEVCIHMCEVAP